MLSVDFTREEVIAALKEIDKTGTPPSRKSSVYLLVYDRKEYSPLYVGNVIYGLRLNKEPGNDKFTYELFSTFTDLGFPVINKKALEDAIEKLQNLYQSRKKYEEINKIIEARDEVFSRFRPIFSSENIENLSSEQLEQFLDFKNNKHWSGLNRTKGQYLENIAGVRKVLSTLLDETTSLGERFNKINEISEKEGIKGLGKGILTAILQIAYPDRYGVWNSTSEGSLKKANLLPVFRSKATEGEKYESLNEVLKILADKSGVDLWTLDALWWESSLFQDKKTRYWQIAPERNASEWDAWKEGNFIALYYSELIGRTGQAIISMPFDQIVSEFRETYPDSSGSPGPRHIDNFLHVMQPGDKIVVNQGRTSVLALGQVDSPPYWDNKKQDKIARRMIWNKTSINTPIPENLKGKFGKTLTELSEGEYNLVAGEQPNYWGILPSEGSGKPGKELLYWDIWYQEGVVTTSFWKDFIAANKDSLLDFSFEEYEKAFTDSYPGAQKDMIWKFIREMRVGDKILLNRGKRTIFAVGEVTSEPYIYESGDSVARKIDWTLLPEEIPLPVSIKNRFARWIISLTTDEYNRILQLRPLPEEYRRLDQILMKKGQVILYGPPGTGKTYHARRYISFRTDELPDIPDNPTNLSYHRVITFHPSHSYEEFIEGIMPSIGEDGTIYYTVKEGIFKQICRDAFNILLNSLNIGKVWENGSDIPDLTPDEMEQINARSLDLPLFLMIDEINRGDISRILGELITLLENDKRMCRDNEMSTILPYSRTRFAIPPNLFIIGTMNSADKSIALVDVALRRRFGFIEMLPDPATLRGYLTHDSLEIQKVLTLAINVLEEINARIMREFDRDHQIGHSYLMRLKTCSTPDEATSELWSIWYDEIMPLLQEYFYDAPTRLHSVLGEGFVDHNTRALILKPEKDEEELLTALQDILTPESA